MKTDYVCGFVLEAGGGRGREGGGSGEREETKGLHCSRSA